MATTSCRGRLWYAAQCLKKSLRSAACFVHQCPCSLSPLGAHSASPVLNIPTSVFFASKSLLLDDDQSEEPPFRTLPQLQVRTPCHHLLYRLKLSGSHLLPRMYLMLLPQIPPVWLSPCESMRETATPRGHKTASRAL